MKHLILAALRRIRIYCGVAGAQPVSQQAARIAAEVHAFHGYRRAQPFWTPGAAQALIHLLDTSSVDGLSPATYRTDGLRRLVARTFADPRQDRRPMDLALSHAFVSFAADLANAADTGVVYVDPAARPRPVRPNILLLRASESGSVQRYIETLAWMNPVYARLRSELVGQASDPRASGSSRLTCSALELCPADPGVTSSSTSLQPGLKCEKAIAFSKA